ncbi:hypothetical protein ACWDYH_18345 [Nocardia goodfellowii]
MKTTKLPINAIGGRYVRSALVIIALLPFWIAGGTADAATKGFPSPGTTFLIQAEITKGGTLCATQSDGKSAIKFTGCDKTDKNQQWFQREVDGDGYGMVYSAAGVCIDENAKAKSADKCAKSAKPERLMWKQDSDGTVRNNNEKTAYWSARGTGEDAGLTLTPRSEGATEFTVVQA